MSNDKYIRCPLCDYQWTPVGGKQSSFFDSLPDEERKKRRFTTKHHRTGEIIVGCTDCYGHEVSEKNRPVEPTLTEQADELLRSAT